MNKRLLIFGLTGTLLISSLMSITVVAEDVEEATSETIATQEILTLSLEEAIGYALENSRDIEIQEIELLKAEVAYEEDIRDVKKGEKNIDVIPLRDPLGAVIEDASINRSLIESGASRRSVVLAYNVAKWNKDMKINEIKYNVEKSYFDLLQMKKEFLIAEENLELSQKQYEHGKLKFNLGMLSKQQLLGIEMGLSQAQSVLDSSKLYYDLQLMSFQNTLGLPFDQQVSLTDVIEYKEHEVIDTAISIKQGLDNNVGIKTAKENFELSKLTLKAVSGRYPEITYRYREQEAEVAKAEKNLETTKNGVEMGVRSAVLNLITAEKQIKTFEKTITQAQENLRIAQISFDLGRNTSTDVTQANINLMNAKKDLSKQIHAYNMALLDYEYSIGIGKGF